MCMAELCMDQASMVSTATTWSYTISRAAATQMLKPKTVNPHMVNKSAQSIAECLLSWHIKQQLRPLAIPMVMTTAQSVQ